MNEKTFLGLELWRWIIGILILAIGMSLNYVPQEKPKLKQQNLMQDTVKLDTIPLRTQQRVYKQQMTIQMSKMDSLLIKKKKQL